MGEVIFKKVQSYGPVAEFLAHKITTHLKDGGEVTWLVTGGSAINVALAVSHKLAGQDLTRLSTALTDERFVSEGGPDSNWQQLLDAGFDLPGANLYPILSGKDSSQTTTYYDEVLHEILDGDGYKIGLFGMGPDGHIAALFPGYPQINEHQKYAIYLEGSPKPPPLRMSITLAAIQRLNEAVIFARGKEKHPMIENLAKVLPPQEQPAQLLKTVPNLTIFNEFKGEEV